MMEIDPRYPTLKESGIDFLSLVKRGKVRDVYRFDEDQLLFVTTDRISTHDVVYRQCIPHKGFGLTQTTIFAFSKTKDIVPNHYISSPDPNCMVVLETEQYPVEVIVRGILTGSAWKAYQNDGEVCGIKLPDGMRKNQRLEAPILTPSTKAETGHDVNITRYNAREIVGPAWDEIEEAALKLFERGDFMASLQGAMLADTKFEFGKGKDNDVMLIDEALTHDSSRFLYISDWERSFREGREPNWIDKQLVRNYSESLGFRGEGEPPELPEDIITGASKRVLEVYKLLSGRELWFPEEAPTDERIIRNLEGLPRLKPSDF